MDVYIPIIRGSGDEKSPDTLPELKAANTFEDEIFRRLEEILQKMEGCEDEQRNAD